MLAQEKQKRCLLIASLYALTAIKSEINTGKYLTDNI
jgi:hypothetical protein